MKPLKTIIKMTAIGVMLFALNACDKKSADDANVTTPTQTTRQGTQSDGASASELRGRGDNDNTIVYTKFLIG